MLTESYSPLNMQTIQVLFFKKSFHLRRNKRSLRNVSSSCIPSALTQYMFVGYIFNIFVVREIAYHENDIIYFRGNSVEQNEFTASVNTAWICKINT